MRERRFFFLTLAVAAGGGACLPAARATAMPQEIAGLASMMTGLSPTVASGRDMLVQQVMRQAEIQGVPPALADAVAVVETGYNPGAIGGSGEIGLMQIRPSTAAMLGFHGTVQELFDPATNIRLSVAYLARAWEMSGGNVCRALMKYRAGWGQEVMTPLSIRYCERAHQWLASIGSPLARGKGAALPLAPYAPDPFVIPITGPHSFLAQTALSSIEMHPAMVASAGLDLSPKTAPLHPTNSWSPPPPFGYRTHRLQATVIEALEARLQAHRRHY